MESLAQYLQTHGLEHEAYASICPFLTMGIGGDARYVVVVHTYEQLKDLTVYLCTKQLPFVLLGGGSNVVFSQDIADLVVVVNRTAGIGIDGPGLIRVNSGVSIRDLMEWNVENGIGGMEFLAGIPGTVGGAAAVNAGAFGEAIATLLEKAEIVTRDGEIKTVYNDYFGFVYRNSAFKYGDEVILDVYLNYTRSDSARVKEAVEEKLRYREENHPGSVHRSAGCFFKNPVINGIKNSAGKLIESAGFKGTSFRNLEISDEHANFVINKGRAGFEDVKGLEDRIAGKIFRDRGIKLEREVIYVSPEGKKY